MTKTPLPEDDVPSRDMKAQPKTQPKASPRPPATKAEHAAMKRRDKMVVKRMRKR